MPRSPGLPDERIGTGERFGRVTMHVFVRGNPTMIAAPVQRDVHVIPKGPHYPSMFTE
jgi:hypothetical protein